MRLIRISLFSRCKQGKNGVLEFAFERKLKTNNDAKWVTGSFVNNRLLFRLIVKVSRVPLAQQLIDYTLNDGCSSLDLGYCSDLRECLVIKVLVGVLGPMKIKFIR